MSALNARNYNARDFRPNIAKLSLVSNKIKKILALNKTKNNIFTRNKFDRSLHLSRCCNDSKKLAINFL